MFVHNFVVIDNLSFFLGIILTLNLIEKIELMFKTQRLIRYESSIGPIGIYFAVNKEKSKKMEAIQCIYWKKKKY